MGRHNEATEFDQADRWPMIQSAHLHHLLGAGPHVVDCLLDRLQFARFDEHHRSIEHALLIFVETPGELCADLLRVFGKVTQDHGVASLSVGADQ